MVHSPFQYAKVSFSQSVGDVFVLAWDIFQVVLCDFLAALFARVFIHVCGDMGWDVVDVLVRCQRLEHRVVEGRKDVNGREDGEKPQPLHECSVSPAPQEWSLPAI